jgi:hypothetical protein
MARAAEQKNRLGMKKSLVHLIRRAQMLPMLGREVVEGEQRVAIPDQAFNRLVVFDAPDLDESVEGGKRMIFKLAEAAEKSWRRLNGHNQLPKIILGIKFTDGIEVVRSQAQTAAA